MQREQALQIVREQLTEQRYVHTIGVMETAIELAERFGGDVKKAELAAIFHDYAKFRPKEEMKKIILEQEMNEDLLIHSPELWHAPVGAYLVHTEVGVNDVEVLDAIRFHTSGRLNMTLLDKIIYLADYIEPGRNFPGVDKARKHAEVNLDKALRFAVRKTMIFLLERKQAIYPYTLEMYNNLVINKEAK